MQINDINNVVAAEFAAVNDVIHSELSSRVPLVEQIAEYIVSSGGKRLRPLVTLLLGKTLGYESPHLIHLATIIEFLHTATLLHDDVVDMSSMRRGKATANQRWGNAPSVLVGDFLYSRAFQLMVKVGNLEVMNQLANATNVIAEGEVLQLMNVRNPDLSERDYMKVIEGKTAMLFAAATGSAAALASASPERHSAAMTYGTELGLAFQIQDDVLDYAGDSAALGKNVGDDLAEGKVTLPLIYTLQHTDETTRKMIRQAIRKGGTQDVAPILAAINKCGALTYCQEKALACSANAQAALEHFPNNDARSALHALAKLAVERSV
ncbi:MAG: polyprenyl synthetase family protein [Natronospirillum sp.]